MCGIYGAVSLARRPLSAPDLLAAMGRALAHRGPDGHAIVGPPHAMLGTERLRIVDLDPRADQPFTSPDGRCLLACNGEIYNQAELRRAHPDYPFRSRSDVESILPLYLAQGERAVPQLDGMFGLAIWDDERGRLLLARDRAGEKPLFFTRLGEEIWFASEVQALLALPAVSRRPDLLALRQYLTLGYVLEPRTTFAAIRRVEAGTIALFEAAGHRVVRYWDPLALAGAPPPADPTADRLQSIFEHAVEKQVQADVPIGVFTSGGIDSSLLAALTARQLGPSRVHTYAARFSVDSFDESPWAATLASRLGTVHHEVNCDEAELEGALWSVVDRLAEPLADPAVLPTFLLARAARRDVTVILSGEGADELFGGYPTYLGHKLAPLFTTLPGPLRRAILALANRIPADGRNLPLGFLVQRFLADAVRPPRERHLAWFATGFARPDFTQDWLAELVSAPAPAGDLAATMYLDYRTYLRDDLLVKVDRATMMHSIEARAPYLDRDLSAFAFALPTRLKVRGLTTKWLLKRCAERRLPRDIVRRRKRGLSVPVAALLNGRLRGAADRLLAPPRLARRGLVDVDRATRLLAEHRSGQANHGRALWALFLLEAWLERWMPELEVNPAGDGGDTA